MQESGAWGLEMGKDFDLGLTLIKAKRGREKKISRLKLVSAVRAGKRIKWKYLKDGWFVENSQLSVGKKDLVRLLQSTFFPGLFHIRGQINLVGYLVNSPWLPYILPFYLFFFF